MMKRKFTAIPGKGIVANTAPRKSLTEPIIIRAAKTSDAMRSYHKMYAIYKDVMERLAQ